MGFRERVEASPLFWIISTAATAFVLGIGCLGAVAPILGLRLAFEGTYLTQQEVEQGYLARAEVEERFVPRGTYEECRQQAAGQGQEDRAWDQELASCEAELRAARTGMLDAGLPAESVVAEGNGGPAGGGAEVGPAEAEVAVPGVRSKSYELDVIAVEASSQDIHLLVEARPVGDGPYVFGLEYIRLLDHNGELWILNQDPASLTYGSELPPETRIRSRLRFIPRGAGRRQPHPPYTLTATERSSGERVVIQGLRPDG